MLHHRVVILTQPKGGGHQYSSTPLRGVCRFVGDTDFNRSTFWLGIELDLANGKHDGAVHGVRYFECAPGHGLFVKPTTVVLEQDYAR